MKKLLYIIGICMLFTTFLGTTHSNNSEEAMYSNNSDKNESDNQCRTAMVIVNPSDRTVWKTIFLQGCISDEEMSSLLLEEITSLVKYKKL